MSKLPLNCSSLDKQIDKEKIDKEGWQEIGDVFSNEDVISIASSFDAVVPHLNGEMLTVISPSDGKDKITGTFSNRFGHSTFPLHTDTAFWTKPARYIVMAMLEKSNCNTHIINFNELLADLNDKALMALQTATYLISTIEGKKYTSPLLKTNGEQGIRFDPSCMTPINDSALYFHQAFLEVLDKTSMSEINWTGNKAVVIDNWNVLHGRGEICSSDKNRKLLRVYTR